MQDILQLDHLPHLLEQIYARRQSELLFIEDYLPRTTVLKKETNRSSKYMNH